MKFVLQKTLKFYDNVDLQINAIRHPLALITLGQTNLAAECAQESIFNLVKIVAKA